MSILRNLLSSFGKSGPEPVDHDTFCEGCASGTLHVIDVREPHEYAAGHVPSAINHPLSQFDPSALPTDKPVVLICQAGARSARALDMAHSAGRTDVSHYAPGTGGWRAQGGKIEV